MMILKEIKKRKNRAQNWHIKVFYLMSNTTIPALGGTNVRVEAIEQKAKEGVQLVER